MNPAKVAREQVEILTDLPNIGKAMAADLHLLGIECQRNAEKLCNVEGYEDQRDRLRTKLEKIERKHGVTLAAEVTGDPRGYCLRVVMPQGDYNTWGGAEHGYGFGGC